MNELVSNYRDIVKNEKNEDVRREANVRLNWLSDTKEERASGELTSRAKARKEINSKTTVINKLKSMVKEMDRREISEDRVQEKLDLIERHEERRQELVMKYLEAYTRAFAGKANEDNE